MVDYIKINLINEERRQLLLEKRGREPTEAQLKGWQKDEMFAQTDWYSPVENFKDNKL